MAAWTPPADPDVGAILDEAREDAREGRLDDALAKHVWFFDHALDLEPSYYGVRLSFALGDWAELAERHPPALTAMQAARDAAERRVTAEGVAGREAFHAFHDFEALNTQLGEDDKTVQAFCRLDEEFPRIAAKVYHITEPLLVDAEKYELCGRYVRPDFTLDTALSAHEIETKRLDRFDSPSERRLMGSGADGRLCDKIATLIAVLVRNDRSEEGREIADLVRPHLSRKGDLDRIDAALKGKPPAACY